jgi:hypothetical protein
MMARSLRPVQVECYMATDHVLGMKDTAADQPHKRTVECPVCHSHGALLHHDIRSSLRYACERCLHEWQIEPAEEPLEVDPTISTVPLEGS